MPAEQTITRRELLKVAAVGAAASSPSIWGAASVAGVGDRLTIVDPHVHVWKNDPQYPWPAELTNPPKDDALPETLLALMQAHGVEKTVIVHVIYYRWDCRYTAASVAARRDRFSGVCRVDPQSAQAVAELERWTHAGFHGVRLSPGPAPRETGFAINPPWTRFGAARPSWPFRCACCVPSRGFQTSSA